MNAPVEAAGFAGLGLRPELLRALGSLGYEEPTPIQAEAIPPLLAGRDLCGQAATGTGKTAAFALPVLHRMSAGPRDTGPRDTGPAVLVLVPTRELAMQVSQAFHRYGSELGVRVLPIYGGQPIGRQLQALGRGVDVVVATPGRALDHIGRGTLRLDGVATVVLDEADEMLDMGFADDIEEILGQTPAGRQTLLFSATMPARINRIADQHLQDPVRIEMGRQTATWDDTPLIRQSAYLVARPHKPAALGRVLDVTAPTAAIVFCRTREEVDQLTETLNGRGYRAEALHGGMGQEQRDRVMGRLRNRVADLVIATDVAARGLDVEQLSLVVNYNVPSAPDAYVHRIGRVGRAGREGAAITLAEPREHRMLKAIERATGRRIPVEQVPTVADLRARRLDLTRAALRETLLTSDSADELAHFRVVVETLTDEFDLMEVALAAAKLAHEAMGGESDEAEIPAVAEPSTHTRPRRETGRGDSRGHGADRGTAQRRGPARLASRGSSGEVARLFLGVGRRNGARPQDLVGAIAGESGLPGSAIGAIEIADRFSLVEVPEPAAAEVIAALRQTTIKGRKVTVRRDRPR